MSIRNVIIARTDLKAPIPDMIQQVCSLLFRQLYFPSSLCAFAGYRQTYCVRSPHPHARGRSSCSHSPDQVSSRRFDQEGLGIL